MMTEYQNLETLTYTPIITKTEAELDKIHDKAQYLIEDNYLTVAKDTIDEDWFFALPIGLLFVMITFFPTMVLAAVFSIPFIPGILMFAGFLTTAITVPLALIKIGRNMNRKVDTIRQERSHQLAQWLKTQGITVSRNFYDETEYFKSQINFTDEHDTDYIMRENETGDYALNVGRKHHTQQPSIWFNKNPKTTNQLERLKNKTAQLKTSKLTPENQHTVSRANNDLKELIQLHKELGENRTKQHKQQFNQLLAQLETELDEVATTSQKNIENRLEAHKQYILGRSKNKLELEK